MLLLLEHTLTCIAAAALTTHSMYECHTLKSNTGGMQAETSVTEWSPYVPAWYVGASEHQVTRCQSGQASDYPSHEVTRCQWVQLLPTELRCQWLCMCAAVNLQGSKPRLKVHAKGIMDPKSR